MYRVSNSKVKRWQSTDTDTQSHALKSMNAFLSCISFTLLQHPLIQDSILDMVIALGGILQSDNKRILDLAADVAQKLVTTLGNTIHRYPMSEVIIHLSCLLSLSELPVAISSAIALNRILTNLGPARGKVLKEIWKALEKADSVGNVMCALQNYEIETQPIEYFLVMATLLESILRRWSLSRYPVWSNSKLMVILQDRCSQSEISISNAVLKLYSALALCGNVAVKLLENKDFLSMVVRSMGLSVPFSVRIEALRLCQCLSRSGDACSMLNGLYCEPIIQGLVGALGGWRSSCSKRVPSDQLPLVLEACRATLLTRWAGNHHSYFWKHEIDRVLLDILLGDCTVSYEAKVALSSDELVAIIYDNTADTRPFVWDILGNLAVYCKEDFLSKTKGALCYLDFLISCACSVATDLMRKGCSSLSSYMNELEPVSRAVLLMVFSPCKYIASQAIYYLSETLRAFGDVCLEYVLASLKLNASGDVSLVADSYHTITNLISLACYSTLPKYHELIVKREGISSLSSIIMMCLNGDIHIGRSNNASHLQSISYGTECCLSNVSSLEGEEVILLYSLQALSQLIAFLNIVCNHHKIVLGEIVVCKKCRNSDAYNLFESLWYILNNSFGSGPKWYSAYILSFFGFYGFPSKLGKKIAKAIDENELADIELLLAKGQSLQVHSPIIVARCPYLLSNETSLPKKSAWNDWKDQNSEHHHRKMRHEIRISDRVDSVSFVKLLEYIYTGFIQADDNLRTPLKVLAKHCGLKSLYDMLSRKLPEWGTACASCNFSEALEPIGNQLSDIILEAKVIEGVSWSCAICRSSVPHMHAHKIILLSSCDYLRALFQSGMHDSCSQVIKVPISWKALVKLVHWFYLGYLPSIKQDCTWNNLDPEWQLRELQVYVELSSLAEFWCLEEVEEQSFKVVVSCINSQQKSSLELIRFAASLNQWKIVTVGVSSIASIYPKLRDGGELEDLDEELVDMLRAKYVCYCQHGDNAFD
ncbi:BTB/POZ domain-containing protein At1g04390-like isoform X2 [Musa acuminata AAA Group]|uniref:BTB/POZ domain-containing protein At1g04390 isoform X2 n=1 Tax=Musa acuminata AAA Group TaxID=214697 RepID=UPI0031E1B1F0